MTYYQDNHITIYNSDCRYMDELTDNSIQCVVTSPPYWGLRKYSGEQELIWGDKNCEHQWDLENKQTGQKHWNQGGEVIPNKDRIVHNGGVIQTGFCSLCGAWKGAYGLEPTPEMYIEHTIEILREIRRVLRKDGVVFWDIGDSYMGSGQSRGKYHETGLIKSEDNRSSIKEKPVTQMKHDILKPKDLCLIPFRVALEAQRDGWWVRSVIIWSKPNPMPESVTDRPTESHEYILMLTKSSKYYWDADAVRESSITGNGASQGKATGKRFGGPDTNPVSGFGERELFNNPLGRNIRSVWEFPTHPYPEAHFAVFPEKLPGICIKAASRPQDIVLDPFAGAGTTLWVAKKLNRKAVGYELSKEYCDLALERNRQQVIF